MGYNNGNKYNKDESYAKKSLKQLLEEKEQFEKAVERKPLGPFNEHLEYIRLKIAERIIGD